jgi:hypothetical protein
LPDSKSAKIQTIIDLSDKFPGLFAPEQILDLVDLADTNKFNDIASSSIHSAESLYEDLIQGRPVAEPQPYENLIIHWQTFISAMQDRNFKEQIPEDRRNAVIDYVRALEMLMHQKSLENMMFAQKLQTLELFPVIYILPPPPLPMDPTLMGAAPMDEGAPVPLPGELPPPDVMPEAAVLPPLDNQMTPDQVALDPNITPTGTPRGIN